VKNNLQTISSLLRLQARRSDEPETRIALVKRTSGPFDRGRARSTESRAGRGGRLRRDRALPGLLVEDTVLALHPVEIVVNGNLGVLSTDSPLAGRRARRTAHQRGRARVHWLWRKNNDQVGVVTLNLYLENGEAVARYAITDGDSKKTSPSRCPRAWDFRSCATSSRAVARTIEMKSVDYADGGGTCVRVAVPLNARP